jgi:PAS domain S-box-containing protein
MNYQAEIIRLEKELEQERVARKRAEYLLAEKPANDISKIFADIYNNTQALICTHDLKGTLLSISPAVCRIMESEEKELLGRCIVEFMPEHRRADFNAVYLHELKELKKSQGVLSLISKSGKEVFQLYQNFLIEEEFKEPYVLGYAQDITDRVIAERDLMQSKKLTQDEANAKEAFLANMSHEIRTPMNGILGIAELLAKTSLSDQQKNFLRLLQDSAQNLLAIVNDVLDLEKIIAGKLQLESLPFKIVDKLAITIQSFIYRAEDKGVAIVFQNFIPGDLVIMGDPFRLSQVLNNLLSNALKFTEKGKIVITSRIKRVEDEKVILEFSGRDTGIGISDETMQQIFQPFVQANSSISRKYGGTGLGLTICKSLLDMQGGAMQVESREGFGSTFSFSIPYEVSVEPFQEVTDDQQVNYSGLGRRRVLVAEDVELNQFIAKQIMESWGFDVTLVSDGKQAVEKATNYHYDLILMDIQMPEMDGLTATAGIRALQDVVKAKVPIIALTANVLKHDANRYLASGMNDHISKPFTEASLFKVVAKHISAQALKEPPAIPKILMPEVASEKLYDLTMIRSISGGDEEFVQNMILLFNETVPETLNDLNKYFDTANWEMVSKMAHKLKSTVDSMGIRSIHQDIKALELQSKKQENLSELPARLEKVNNVVNATMEQLKVELTTADEMS